MRLQASHGKSVHLGVATRDGCSVDAHDSNGHLGASVIGGMHGAVDDEIGRFVDDHRLLGVG